MRVRLVVGAVLLATCAQTALSAQASLTLIRDADQAVACALSAPAKSLKPDDDLVTVEIRVPSAPPALLLAKLPPRARDYRRLPIEVFLVPAPARGATPVLVKQPSPV